MNLFPVVLFLVIGLVMGAAIIGLSYLLGAKHKGQREESVYESGMNPVGSATRYYDVKFYLTAILFLLFDVEIVFLVPWALVFKNSPAKEVLLIEIAFFFLALIVGYVFVLLSQSLNWEN